MIPPTIISGRNAATVVAIAAVLFIDGVLFNAFALGSAPKYSADVLRDFFEIDGPHVVVTVIQSLVAEGALDGSVLDQAIERYGIDRNRVNPLFHESGPSLHENRG